MGNMMQDPIGTLGESKRDELLSVDTVRMQGEIERRSLDQPSRGDEQ